MNALKISSIAKQLFSDLRADSKVLRDAEVLIKPKELIEDLFFALFATVVQTVNEEAPHAQRMLVVMSMPIFDELRDMTTLNVVESAVGALALAEKLSEVEEPDSILGKFATRAAANNAIAGAIEEIQNVESLEESLGGGSGGGIGSEAGESVSQGSLQKRLTLATAMRRSQKLKNVIQLCGRLEKVYDDAAKRNPDPCGEIDGIEHGRDLTKIVPSELVLEEDFFDMKYVEEKLQQFTTSARVEEGLGPIILLQDKSGSMAMHSDAEGFDRDDWGTAIAITTLRAARAKLRELRIVHYTTETRKSWTFAKGQARVDDMVDMIERSASGGTSLANVLPDVEMPEKADLFIVTDGQDNFDVEALVKHCEKTNARVFAILIGSPSEPLREACERTGGRYCDSSTFQSEDVRETWTSLLTSRTSDRKSMC